MMGLGILLASWMAVAAGAAPGETAPVVEAPEPQPQPSPPAKSSVEHKPGLGILVTSPDGSFALQTWLRGQLRYSFSHVPAGMPADQHLMEVKRASLFFAGHAFGEHNKYFVQLVFDPRDLGWEDGRVTQSPIFDTFFTFDYLRDLSIRVGQYKPFFSRQFIAGWGDLQLVDRSTVQSEFLLDRDIGFDVFSNDLGGIDKLRYSAGIYFGQGRNWIAPRPFHMTYLARFEVLPMGGFDEYVEADFERRRKPKLAMGAAYAFQDHARGERGVAGPAPADGGSTDMHSIVGDAIFKVRGFSALAEVFWRDGYRNSGNAVDEIGNRIPVALPRNGLGWFAQAGFLLPKVPIEVAARGGMTSPLGDSALADAGELGGGLNWYVRGHPFKLQADYFRTWSAVPLGRGNDTVRMQFQLAI